MSSSDIGARYSLSVRNKGVHPREDLRDLHHRDRTHVLVAANGVTSVKTADIGEKESLGLQETGLRREPLRFCLSRTALQLLPCRAMRVP